MTAHNRNQSKRLEDLYPGHTPEWYTEAQANLDTYFALVIRIYERISADPEAYSRLQAELIRPH